MDIALITDKEIQCLIANVQSLKRLKAVNIDLRHCSLITRISIIKLIECVKICDEIQNMNMKFTKYLELTGGLLSLESTQGERKVEITWTPSIEGVPPFIKNL